MTTSIADSRWLRLAAGSLFLAASVAPAWAQEPAGIDAVADKTVTLPTDAVITPEARAVLDRMTATLKSLKGYEVTAQITRDEVMPYGYKLQNNESARMWVQTPNRLRLEVEGDIKNRTYVYDGSQLAVFAADSNVYTTTEAPSTLRELVSTLLDAGVEMPLIDMLYQGAVGNLADNARVGLVVGDSQVDGAPTDHLAFRQPDVDWQLWVEKGAQALPRKLLITTRYEAGEPQYQATLKWNLKPGLQAKLFTFEPPSGATKIPYHGKLAAGGGDK